MDKKREEFRKYLEKAGALDNLTKTLVKLYEEKEKPADAVKFIRKNLCESCPDDDQFQEVTAELDRSKKIIFGLERELSRLKGSIKRSASEVDMALTRGFDELRADVDSKAMLKKFLTKEVLDELKSLKTKFKGTLLDCIQSGLETLDAPIGVFACDPDAYVVFASLFNSVIEELHGFKQNHRQPAIDWGEACNLPELDPEGDKIISICLHCCRSVENFPFAAIMSVEHFEEIIAKVQSSTKCLCGDLKGIFHPLEGMDSELKKTLNDAKILFEERKPTLKAANATRFWPTGRGIFVGEAKTFVVWCNEEDHLRFISMEQGGNLSKTIHASVLIIIASSSFFPSARASSRKCLRSSDNWCHSSRQGHSFQSRRAFGILEFLAGKLGKCN